MKRSAFIPGLKIFILVLAEITFAAGSRAAEFPDPALPAGVGVNIHFTREHERDIDLIAAGGFKFIRMDFFWESIETKKGQYDWSAYDELTANLERRGVRPYYILDYSNPLYEEIGSGKNPINGKVETARMSPQHPESVAAFARFAAAATEHFHGRHVIWEIWNEPNGSFWELKPDVRQYTTLALETCKAIRRADPQATIVAPATSGFQWDFMEAFLKSGALEFIDGVSVHPYRSPRQPPESAAGEYRRLRELIERYAPTEAKKKIPIISGEWGYSSNTKGVSPETQAAFLVRQQLSNLLLGVPISIWYDWKNDGSDPNENEHNFGTVTPDLHPKPAYLAVQTLTRELSGYRISQRFDTGNTNDFVLVLTNAPGETKLAAWTRAAAHPMTLTLQPTSLKELTVLGINGNESKIKIDGNRAELSLDGNPEYIALGKATLANL
ncbi:MAG TPA: cellulase family glycosylhydrolase [Verrucomicrobiae bacterium]|nr:cellulase family glycosylhydrolase [Verrucomicrobiae bacterium]